MANYTEPNYVYARPRYFDGQYLIDQDFADEQIYHIDRAWRHNRLLHVAGIAEGLTVSVPDATKPFEMAVAPGTAIDSLGRTLVLPDRNSQNAKDTAPPGWTIDMTTYAGKAGNLVLVYPVDQTQGMATTQKFGSQTSNANTETRFSEWGQLQFVPDGAQLPAGAVGLAYLTVNDTAVTIDLTARQYSGLRLPSPEDNAPLTLRTIVNSGGVKTAQLAGSLAVSGTVGIGTVSPRAALEVNGAIMPAATPLNATAAQQQASGLLFPPNPGGGANDSAWLRYYPRSGEQMTLELGIANDANDHIALMTAGNVGISNNSPSQKLQVDGGNVLVRGANNFAASGNTAAVYVGDTNHVLQSTNGTGVKLAIPASESVLLGSSGQELTIGGGGDITVVGNTNYGATTRQMLNLYNTTYGIGVQGYTQYFRTYKNFAWYKGGTHSGTELDPGTGGVAQLVIKDGSVGIGTNNPGQKLQVDAGNMLVRGGNNFGASGNTATVYLGDTTHFIQSIYGTGVTIGTNGVSNGIVLLQTSGKVGIGTASPRALLEVNGAIMPAATPMNATADQLNASGILFPPNPGGGSGDSAWLRYYPRSGEQMTLELGTSNDADDHIALMPAGNVGIGINSPTEKLEVNGRIKDQTGYVMPVGAILPYLGSAAPAGWLLCDGIPIPSDAKYQTLKDLIGNNTPNLKGLTLIGAGAFTDPVDGNRVTTYQLKATGGEKTHKLTTSEMPVHSHSIHGGNFGLHYQSFQGEDDKDLPYETNPNTSLGGTDNTGGGAVHNNLPPYYVVNYIIKY